jgi:membrane-bound metal-dependent hydrolase YbcI (DUF457 family)
VILRVALLLSGVLVFADARGVSALGLFATIGLLIAIGYRDGSGWALLWAFLLVGSAVIADALWQAGWEPFNRSDEYEAIPQTPFVVIGIPLPMAIIGFGVLARRSDR